MDAGETYTVHPHEWGPGKTHYLTDGGALLCRPSSPKPPGERGDDPVNCVLCERKMGGGTPRKASARKRVPAMA